MNPDVRVLGSHVATLGESPVWSGRDSTLYWVDVDGCSIQALSWGSTEPATWALPGRPSCIAMTEDASSFIVGETFTLGKHPQGTEVKAITYSAMRVTEAEGRTDVLVIVDI